MLKALFSSKARIKLLKLLLLNPDQEFFVRELTRRLGEQINSIRRELLSFKKIGLVKYRSKNRKKYYYINKEFLLFEELQRIFQKTQDLKADIVDTIKNMGTLDFIAFSGVFVGRNDSPADILIVGNINKDDLESYLEHLSDTRIKYSLMDRASFLYRIEYNDTFLAALLKDPETIIPVNHFKEQLKK